MIYSLRNLKLNSVVFDVSTDDEEKELFQDFMLKTSGVYVDTRQLKINFVEGYKNINIDVFWILEDGTEHILNSYQYFNTKDIAYSIEIEDLDYIGSIMHNNTRGILNSEFIEKEI